MECVRINLKLCPIVKNPSMKKDMLPPLNFVCVHAQNYSVILISPKLSDVSRDNNTKPFWSSSLTKTPEDEKLSGVN